MKLIRYELAFDQELQDIGIFQGIDEILPPHEATEIINAMDSKLDIPVVSQPCKFFFTENGEQTIRPFLEERYFPLLDKSSLWSVARIELEIPDETPVLFRDRLQVALSRKTAETVMNLAQWTTIPT